MNSELLNLIENAPKVTLGASKEQTLRERMGQKMYEGYQTQKASWRLEQILKDAR